MPLARLATVDAETAKRWHWQALVYRIMYGYWREDLRSRIVTEVGKTRAQAWGEPDIGANLLKSSAAAVSTLHDRPARGLHDDPGAVSTMKGLMDGAAWQVIGQTLQRDTLAVRNMLLHVNIVGEAADRRVALLPVGPHDVEVVWDPGDPWRMLEVKWWRLRDVNGQEAWTCDVWDIRPGRERYAIENERGEDVSPTHLRAQDGTPAPPGGYRGEAYPFRADGVPILPWVSYTASKAPGWDTMANSEIVDSTLTVGTLWTYWRHLVQTASWPQRYVLNGYPVGATVIGEGAAARRQVEADPAILQRIKTDEDSDTAASIQQDTTNADPKALGEAIFAYERRAMALAGLNPADVVRTSGDPRSGYAMAITRDGQREAQRRYAPIFRGADEEMLRIVAALWGGLPVDGWRVVYEAIPPTVGELIDLQTYVDGEIAAQRMTRLQGYMLLHPDVSAEDAQRALDAIDALAEGPPAPEPQPASNAEPVIQPDEEDKNAT